ncbi:MAG: hypothetical protein WB660_13800 [Candidatus Sulfotelmatobacter sp.]
MSVRNSIVLLLALLALTFLVACGGSSSPAPVAPPSGGFSASNLNGTYVFSSTGADSSGAFLTMVGSLSANGSGSISSGTVDIWGLDAEASAQPITAGSYKITSDGRGQILFNTNVTTINSSGAPTTTGIPFTLDFVLISNAHGFVTEFDSNGTGSGTIDLQSTVSQAQLAGSYAFGLSGVGNSTSATPIATAGALTLDSTGAVTAGQEDINNDGLYSGAPSAIATTSTVTVGTAPATASLVVTGVDTYTFDVYPIDTTHLKLIETDGKLLTAGDAYTQGTSIPTGQLVFTMAGENASSGTPLDSGGWLTNTSGTISAGLEDFNDGGNVNTASGVGGSFSPVTAGRAEVSLSGFVNGAASDVPGTYTFAAYPFTFNGGSGIQLLEIDDAGITSGAAYPQSATTLAASQGYGLNLTAFNSVGEEDDIAEFTTTASGFSGLVDLNDDATLSFDKALTGNLIAPDSNGRGGASTNFFSFNFYVVNSSSFVLLETDTSQVGMGVFAQQTGSGTTGAAQLAPASLLRPVVHAHTARTKQK